MALLNYTASALVTIFLSGFVTLAQEKPIAKIVSEGDRYELTVDGKPFFILGAQIHNSSSWPVMLPNAMRLATDLHVNTVEAPVYWEALEQQPGVFDFSSVDALIEQAREHRLRLVLLWFGSFKTCCSYTPEYIRADSLHYPRIRTANDDPTSELSPYYPQNLNADKRAFAALLRHLKQTDSTERTVIMVQVQNEPGTLDTARDHSPEANRLFAGPLPKELVQALHKKPGTWTDVFGNDAEESFSAWGIARYIDAIAAAGKAEYPLPMYVNTWIGTPDSAMRPGFDYPSGGSTFNVLSIWKIAAPSIDLAAPDIYLSSSEMYRGVLRQFHRADNPLLIPETIGFGPGGDDDSSRFLLYALGEQAIGYSPFGLDSLPPDAFTSHPAPSLEGLSSSYRLLGSMNQKLASLLFAGAVQTAVQEPSHPTALLDFGKWKAVVVFGSRRPSADASAAHLPGRVLVAPLAPDEFLVCGFNSRVTFTLSYPAPHERGQNLRVEEGSYDADTWKVARWLNGDETFTGIQLPQAGDIVHVKLGSYF